METFSASLAICAGNSPIPGEFPSQRPVTRSFDVLFDLHPNKRLSKQPWGWWFETLPRPLWRHRNGQLSSFYLIPRHHRCTDCQLHIVKWIGTLTECWVIEPGTLSQPVKSLLTKKKSANQMSKSVFQLVLGQEENYFPASLGDFNRLFDGLIGSLFKTWQWNMIWKKLKKKK